MFQTLGLTWVMAQSGLLVLRRFREVSYIFEEIFVDIEMSSSLSRACLLSLAIYDQYRDILCKVNQHSLLLLMSWGCTDPQEGAGSAMVILRTPACVKSRLMATTHYPEPASLRYWDSLVQKCQHGVWHCNSSPDLRFYAGCSQ